MKNGVSPDHHGPTASNLTIHFRFSRYTHLKSSHDCVRGEFLSLIYPTDQSTGMTLLYLVPLISSTCSLYFAWDQFFFLRLLLKKDIQTHSNRLQASYWKTFFPQAAGIVVGLISITSGSTCAILRTSAGLLQDKGSYNWYLAGGTLALCHLFWVPRIKPVIESLQDSEKDIEMGPQVLQRWINIHTTRALTVDIACWVSCIVAAVKTLSP